MVASPLREPRPASPDPHEPNHAHAAAPRRPAARAQSAPARRSRPELDSLAIGAPLTAALVGALLTEGDAAWGGASGEPEGGASARRGADDETGAGSGQGGDAARLGAPGSDPAKQGGGTSGEAVDPVVAQEMAGPPAGGGGTDTGTLAPPDAPAPSGNGGDTMVSRDVSINLGAGGALVLPELGELDLDGAPSSGPIGVVTSGTDDDDVIHGTPDDDKLAGGPGDDVLHGEGGDDLLDGGAGDDQLSGGAGDDGLLGGAGEDDLFGGTGDDRLLGGSGDDQLLGEEGRDRLDGGSGNDLLDGGADPDRLTGGAGDDMLIVSNIHDVAFGDGSGAVGGGNNTLVVQPGFATHLLQEMGEERATFFFSENFGQSLPDGVAGYRQQVAGDIRNLTLEGTANHDVLGDSRANVIQGNDGDNQLYGGGGDDILRGGGGNDGLHGGAGADELSGGAGNDRLSGGAADDILHGGDGDDVLYGETGADLLYGGAGDDNYVIGLNDSAVDTVFDHEGSNRLTIEDGAGREVRTVLADDDLHVVVDDAVVAVIDGYRGNEDAFAGIDAGSGLRPIDQLMAPDAPTASSPLEEAPATASTLSAGDDLLGTYLNQPSLIGTDGDDHLVGLSEPDWLVGGAGNDHLVGGAGDDVLEGGRGKDLLEGGAGDDRYLFGSGDGGLSTIVRDGEGANVAQLDGWPDVPLSALVIGQDLVMVANFAPLFTFEDFVGNEQAFAGVQMGDQFIPTEDLLA